MTNEDPTDRGVPGIRRFTWKEGLLLVSAAAMLAALYMAFIWAPTEVNQGEVQRIMYVHVPIALISLALFGVLFVASIGYLLEAGDWRPRRLAWRVIALMINRLHLGTRRWDALAHSTAEVGTLALTLTILTGAIWAKPIWNVWWTWEPLLTTLLILWLMAVAYLVLRAYAPAGDRGPRFAAVLGVMAGLTSPFVYFSVELWGNLTHPEKVVGPAASSEAELGANIALTLLVSFIAVALLVTTLVVQRYSLRRAEDEVDDAHIHFGGQRAPAAR